jgi:hypothetical protein
LTGGQVPDKYETSSTVLQSGSGEEGNSSLQIDSWDGSSVLSYKACNDCSLQFWS